MLLRLSALGVDTADGMCALVQWWLPNKYATHQPGDLGEIKMSFFFRPLTHSEVKHENVLCSRDGLKLGSPVFTSPMFL